MICSRGCDYLSVYIQGSSVKIFQNGQLVVLGRLKKHLYYIHLEIQSHLLFSHLTERGFGLVCRTLYRNILSCSFYICLTRSSALVKSIVLLVFILTSSVTSVPSFRFQHLFGDRHRLRSLFILVIIICLIYYVFR